MKLPDPKRTWDVVLVAAPGRSVDLAHALRQQLASRDLRVKLDIVPRPSVSPLPTAVEEDAKQAAYCVVLVAQPGIAEGGPGSEATMYALIPAPKFHGQWPKFVTKGGLPGPGEIEMGMIGSDAGILAERIAERFHRPR